MLSHIIFLLDFTTHKNIAYEQLINLELRGIESSTNQYIAAKILDQIDNSEEPTTKTALNNQQTASETLQIPNSANSGLFLAQNSTTKKRLKIPKILKEKLLSELYRLMETACTDYMLLWQSIEHENGQISKLAISLEKSQESIKSVLSFYEKNRRYLVGALRAQQVFGRFLKDVIGQKVEGKKLIQEALDRVLKGLRQHGDVKRVAFDADLDGFGTPCLILRSEKEVHFLRFDELLKRLEHNLSLFVRSLLLWCGFLPKFS